MENQKPTGHHSEVLRYDTTKEFDSVDAWSTFDVKENGIGNNPVGYRGNVFDGRFVYFVPYYNGEIHHGEVLRYDTTKEFDSVDAWSTFDVKENGIGNYSAGFQGAVFDEKFVYFVPYAYGKADYNGEVLRYDTTKEFDSVDAWSTFDPGENGVGKDPDGFIGAVFDMKFVYFTPLSNEYGNYHSEVLRYDTTKEFDSVDAWSTFDVKENGIGNNPVGYKGNVFDGRFVYFVPYYNGESNHGEVLRYDTTKEFDSVDAWSTFDVKENGIGNYSVGFQGAVFDEKFVYFVPLIKEEEYHGEVLRYDTTKEFDSVDAWSTFDPGENGVGKDPDGYKFAYIVNEYVYFSPYWNGEGYHGEVLRYDTTKEFDSVDAWSTFDPGENGVGKDPDGYQGITFDGKYIYFAPFDNGSFYE